MRAGRERRPVSTRTSRIPPRLAPNQPDSTSDSCKETMIGYNLQHGRYVIFLDLYVAETAASNIVAYCLDLAKLARRTAAADIRAQPPSHIDTCRSRICPFGSQTDST